MSDRLCGYCRKTGHTKNKCDIRLSQIETIRRHVGEQRLLAYKILHANGIGPGAIVTGNDYWTGEEVPCIVPSVKPSNHYIDWRPVKYKKSVKSSLITYDANPEKTVESHDGLVRYIIKNKIYITGYKLSDPSVTMNICFFLDRLPVKVVTHLPTRGWEYDKPSTLLSPSDCFEIDNEELMEPFTLHERLALDKGATLVRPIIP